MFYGALAFLSLFLVFAICDFLKVCRRLEQQPRKWGGRR